jgi:hypothetical protein
MNALPEVSSRSGLTTRQREGVHVGRLADGHRRQRAALGATAPRVDLVLAAPSELGGEVHELAALGVVVRVRRRELAEPRGALVVAERGQRLGVEPHRDRRLGHRDVLVAELREVHVGVVGEVRAEHRLHALEQRAARVGGEAVDRPAAGGQRLTAGRGVEEAARVGDGAVVEAEAVEHRHAVEPVADRAVLEVHLRGRHAHEAAAQPRGDLAANREGVGADLLGLVGEAEAMVRARR